MFVYRLFPFSIQVVSPHVWGFESYKDFFGQNRVMWCRIQSNLTNRSKSAQIRASLAALRIKLHYVPDLFSDVSVRISDVWMHFHFLGSTLCALVVSHRGFDNPCIILLKGAMAIHIRSSLSKRCTFGRILSRMVKQKNFPERRNIFIAGFKSFSWPGSVWAQGLSKLATDGASGQ